MNKYTCYVYSSLCCGCVIVIRISSMHKHCDWFFLYFGVHLHMGQIKHVSSSSIVVMFRVSEIKTKMAIAKYARDVVVCCVDCTLCGVPRTS